MTPERWRRIENLFEACLDLPDEQRDAWLTAQCGDDDNLREEVRSLLSHAEADPKLELGVQAQGALALRARSGLGPGTRLGAYELIELLGEGGMGAVWRARRADAEYESEVAIKLMAASGVKRGWIERFRAERQMLAALDHPHIARLLDGGSSEDGQPYLVMECVRGEPLLHYCDTRKLGLRARIELFLNVCDAVDHAHRHLIVHRDLKPANILVGEASGPKLL